ncbi:hypothetical protein QAD02_011436 [Eretmocerus hayati]|uniref:Uncharacterized protein n=1 Tax=Eretmocerus hayati TaxID=131215 RepID=A0ACC2NWS5_9HYME|nr:hypothetical protein QAD02_011436 [Eretmocerus hayati]
MMILLTVFCLLGLSQGDPRVAFNTTKVEVHMDEVEYIGFSVDGLNAAVSKVNVTVTSSDLNIVEVAVSQFDPNGIHNGLYNSTINATGIFLGKAEVFLSVTINEQSFKSEVVNLIVTRRMRKVDIIFTASVAILVSILYINFGCAVDWDVCKKTIKRPIGPLIGCFCQFICMPMISYLLAITLFPDNPEMQLGIFFTGISPSGGASNVWTLLLGGNINLSVTMTTLCTLAAFALMPLWIFTLGRHIFDRANLGLPYLKIATLAAGLVIPLAIGYFIQKKLPRLSKTMVRIMKPFSAILVLYIVIFAIVTNLYLFKLFSWEIILAGMGLPWLGFLTGLILSFFLRQPDQDTRAIAIETGIQNTGVPIFLLRFCLDQPAADLTTVVPVSCAIMTPLPLLILYLIKLAFERRKLKRRSSNEKLQASPQDPANSTSLPSSRLNEEAE